MRAGRSLLNPGRHKPSHSPCGSPRKGILRGKNGRRRWRDELKAAANRGEPDDGSHYYHHWLAALERLVAAKRLSDPAAMLARKEAWAEAYRHTPHGKPVGLSNGSS
jgi:hypothetical protein